MKQNQAWAAIIAHKHNLATKTVETIIKDFFNQVSTSLIEGKEVTIPKFGKFVAYKTKSRSMFNNFTKREIFVPIKRKIKFKTHPGLNISLNLIKNGQGNNHGK